MTNQRDDEAMAMPHAGAAENLEELAADLRDDGDDSDGGDVDRSCPKCGIRADAIVVVRRIVSRRDSTLAGNVHFVKEDPIGWRLYVHADD